MIRSFRLKIAVISVLFSVLLLLGFGLYCARVVYAVGLERIDRELRALVDSDIRKEQPPNHWQRLYASLDQVYGSDAERQFMLKARQNETTLYATPNWSAQIEETMFPVQGEISPPIEEETKNGGRRQKERRPSPTALGISDAGFSTVSGWRAIALKNPQVSLCLAMDLAPLQTEVSRIWQLLWMALPVALLIIIASGWALAALALRPVRLISRTAKKVTSLHLDERIPATKADREFRQLIDLINGMLDRLERSFGQAIRFSADAAHELKTPLTILQGNLENALQKAADGSDDQKTYKELLDEVQRLKSIIRKLLLLAQADSGQMVLSREPVNLTQRIEALCDDIQLLAPELEVQADLQPNITVSADPDLLNQVIQNLTGNAVKFSRGESPIRLSLKTENGRAVFRISNRGEAIPDADREKIFERFYRATRATEGSGLGLSLAREIARAHGGDLLLESSAPDGTVFRLMLPQITEP